MSKVLAVRSLKTEKQFLKDSNETWHIQIYLTCITALCMNLNIKWI